MWRIVCCVAVSFCSSFAFSQVQFQFEPSVCTHFVHHINCQLEDKDHHRGVTISPGIRLNFDVSKRFTLIASAVTKNFVGEVLYPQERVYSLNVKYKIGHFKNRPDIDFMVESGLGYNKTAKRLEVPFYFGTAIPVGPVLTWNTRVSLPVFSLRADEIGEFRYAAYGVDMGLAMRFCSSVIPKYTRHGNPFILQ